MSLSSILRTRPGTTPIAVLELCGEVNTETAFELETTLDEVLETRDQLILDLSRVLYVSSAGWRTLIDRGSQGGRVRLRIAGMQPSVREVFELLGLTSVLIPYDSVDAALAAHSHDTGLDAPRPK